MTPEIDDLSEQIRVAEGLRLWRRIQNDSRGARFWERRVWWLGRRRLRAVARWAKQLNGVE